MKVMPPQPPFVHHLLSLVDGFEIKMSHTYDVTIFQASQSYIVDRVNFYLKDLLMILLALQLVRASVNPPELCLKWGDFNFASSHAWKVEVPPLQAQVWGVHAGPNQLQCE